VDSVGLLYVTRDSVTAASQNGACPFFSDQSIPVSYNDRGSLYFSMIKTVSFQISSFFVCDVLNGNCFKLK
jgi:hypothetical protein